MRYSTTSPTNGIVAKCRWLKGEVKRMMNESGARAILVCDTQPVAIEGVRGLLSRCEDLRFVGAVSSLEAAFELTRGVNPAAIVIDKSFGSPAITDWLHRFAPLGERALAERASGG